MTEELQPARYSTIFVVADADKPAAEALAAAMGGWTGGNLTVKLEDAQGNLFWANHAWDQGPVAAAMASLGAGEIPEGVDPALLARISYNARPEFAVGEIKPTEHFSEVIAEMGLSRVVEELP